VKVALYARVSTPLSSKKQTDERERERQDPEVQLVKLRAYAKMRGWEVADEYVDRASGADPDRPELARLTEDIRSHVHEGSDKRIAAVLIVRLDRIMRSLSNMLRILEEFEAWGVKLVAVNQAIETDTATGRLMMHILGAFAEWERETIRERVLDGMAKARADGTKFGRKPRVIDMQLVRELLRNNSQRETAKILGIPLSTLRDRLKSETGHEACTERKGGGCL